MGRCTYGGGCASARVKESSNAQQELKPLRTRRRKAKPRPTPLPRSESALCARWLRAAIAGGCRCACHGSSGRRAIIQAVEAPAREYGQDSHRPKGGFSFVAGLQCPDEDFVRVSRAGDSARSRRGSMPEWLFAEVYKRTRLMAQKETTSGTAANVLGWARRWLTKRLLFLAEGGNRLDLM